MTELQEARQRWLEAEGKVLTLQKQVADLQRQVFELNGQLLQAGVRIYAESMGAFMRGVLATTPGKRDEPR
jgi:hypothetical protein